MNFNTLIMIASPCLAGALLYLVGRRRYQLPNRKLRRSFDRVMECLGLIVAVTVLNITLTFVLLAISRAAGLQVSFYPNTEFVLTFCSFLEGMLFYFWKTVSED